MRTITKKFALRLAAQSQEAKLRGMTKLADKIDNLIKSNNTRDNDASYMYAEAELKDNVESALWNGVVRAADYYDCNIDTADIQKAVESLASQLIEEVRINGHISHGVGAYEPSVPGEVLEKVAIEIDD